MSTNATRGSASCLLAVLAGLSAAVYADSFVYVSIGEAGETAFSDQATRGARRIELEHREMPSLSSAQQVAAMLAVANDLAEARQLREAQRKAKRDAARPPTYFLPDPPAIRDDRYQRYGYLYPPTPTPPTVPDPPEPPGRKTLYERFEPKL